LTSIILFAKHLEQNVDSQVSTYAADLRMLAERALRAARSLAQQLRPLELDEVGLGPALHRVAEQTAQSCGTTIDVVANAPSTPLSYPAEVVVYRIAQEALTNIARHAHATSASVTLSTHDGWLTLLIEDDGVGFEPEPVLDGRGIAGHVGLRTMRERAASIGGEFVVEARNDAGTLVRLRVPISDGAHVRPAELKPSPRARRRQLSSDQRDDGEARP
jgi:signal transduction histidine kinase